jgi:hypothetical protein
MHVYTVFLGRVEALEALAPRVAAVLGINFSTAEAPTWREHHAVATGLWSLVDR